MENYVGWNNPKLSQMRKEHDVLGPGLQLHSERSHIGAYPHPQLRQLLNHILLPLEVAEFILQLREP
jgi:hypothetical protein